MAQIGWVLEHEADLDADFLAIYGIDLEREEISGPRYMALAHRVTAYQGVMAARVEEERAETAPPEPATAAAPGTAPRADGAKEVSLTAFRLQFPGLVSMATG